MKIANRALVIQGGGFRTAFSAGVLDAFLLANYNPFDVYVAVSGGANALSYYLGNQHGKCIDSIYELLIDTQPKVGRLIRTRTILNVDFFHEIASSIVPLDLEAIGNNHSNKKIRFVMTHLETGKPFYFEPAQHNWVDGLIASCTLPFVTKGKHVIEGMEFMDGSWSDPLPVEWAIANGATEVLMIRTTPMYQKEKQSIPDWLGEKYHRKNSVLKTIFANNHTIFNATIDFLASNPTAVPIHQIAPEKSLSTGSIAPTKKSIQQDYEYGLRLGNEYLKTTLHAIP